MQPALLILAGGLGSRYGGFKQIEGVGPSAETLLEYAVFDALRAGFGQLVIVLNARIETAFKQRFARLFEKHVPVEYVLQDTTMLPGGYSPSLQRQKPWGTGHAVWVARKKLNQPFGVINADDFYGPSAFVLLADFLKQTEQNVDSRTFGLTAYRLKNVLSENGPVSRGICHQDDEHNLTQIIEHTHIEKHPQGAVSRDKDANETLLPPETLASMNLFGFTPYFFDLLEEQLHSFLKDNHLSSNAEFFLPAVIDNAIQNNQARVKVLSTDEHWFGVTYPQDKQTVKEAINERIDAGVYPQALWKE